MTFLEKLKKDHPDWSKGAIDDAIKIICPSGYGYEPKDTMGRCEQPCNYERCWKREIPPLKVNWGEEEIHRNMGIPECYTDGTEKIAGGKPTAYGEKVIDEPKQVAQLKVIGDKEPECVGSYTTHTGNIDKCFNCVHRSPYTEFFDESIKECIALSKGEKVCTKYNKIIVGNIIQCDNHVTDSDDSSSTTRTGMIQDSGARREFATGAVRDIQEGKGRCDLLPLDAVSECLQPYCNSFDSPASEILHSIFEYQNTGKRDYLILALNYFASSHMPSAEPRRDEVTTTLCFSGYYTMFLEVSKHFEEGAKKYGEYNWQKGIPTRCYIDSAVRHYLKYLRGDTDEPHDRAFVWNILCCIWTCIHKPELNDYSKSNKELDS